MMDGYNMQLVIFYICRSLLHLPYSRRNVSSVTVLQIELGMHLWKECAFPFLSAGEKNSYCYSTMSPIAYFRTMTSSILLFNLVDHTFRWFESKPAIHLTRWQRFLHKITCCHITAFQSLVSEWLIQNAWVTWEIWQADQLNTNQRFSIINICQLLTKSFQVVLLIPWIMWAMSVLFSFSPDHRLRVGRERLPSAKELLSPFHPHVPSLALL